jgi:hypothetical protein
MWLYCRKCTLMVDWQALCCQVCFGMSLSGACAPKLLAYQGVCSEQGQGVERVDPVCSGRGAFVDLLLLWLGTLPSWASSASPCRLALAGAVVQCQ